MSINPKGNSMLYDSFEGLPEKNTEDNNNLERQFSEGSCESKKEDLIRNFKFANLKLPDIHVGWFGKVPDEEYSKKIAFRFFDVDFYNSIIDSFSKVYPKMGTDARIIIHDYKWEVLPGVERACIDFLKDKPEKGTMYHSDHVGIMIKK